MICAVKGLIPNTVTTVKHAKNLHCSNRIKESFKDVDTRITLHTVYKLGFLGSEEKSNFPKLPQLAKDKARILNQIFRRSLFSYIVKSS